jgi:ribosomal protein S12 methylthiotransferase accessory factor
VVTFERERALSEARESILAYIRKRGWCVDLDTYGTDLVTTRCAIRDADGCMIAGGYGKGHADVSEVGALYEAIEHHHASLENVDVETDCVPVSEIDQDPRFAALPCRSEFRTQKDRRVGCAAYRDFRTGARVRVPLFLAFPNYVASGRLKGDDFDYARTERFGSNSGTAIGATFEEAAIHGLNEIVERDSWSLFLLSHFFETGQIGRLIAPQSLPEHLSSLVALAGERAKRSILLIDVTSDLGIPTFAATVDDILPNEHVHPYGFGTSTYPEYAAYRAITELVQSIDLKEQFENIRRADKISLHVLRDYAKLKACAYFKVKRERLYSAAWQYAQVRQRSLTALLSQTLSQLAAHEIDLSFNIHREVPGVFCVVSCMSIALERFFLVTSGQLMSPGLRGMRLFEPYREGGARTSD